MRTSFWAQAPAPFTYQVLGILAGSVMMLLVELSWELATLRWCLANRAKT